MNKLLFLFFSLTIFVFCCGTPKSGMPQEEVVENGTVVEDNNAPSFDKNLHDIWVVTTIEGQTLSADQTRPRLEVFPEEGRIAGNAGCNEIFGGCHVNGSNITFTRIGTTKKYCQEAMEMERLFIQKIQEVDSYQIKGLQLLLVKAGKTVMTLQKVD
ncbi:MAG: META domain-containing protein [Bacteroidota bacterium]